MKHLIRRILYHTNLIVPAWWVLTCLNPARRAAYLADIKALQALRGKLGGYADHVRKIPADKTILVLGMYGVRDVAMQSPLLLAFRLAGYNPVVLLNDPNPNVMRAYRLFGVGTFVFFGATVREDRVHPAMARLRRDAFTIENLIDMTYKSAKVGKYILSWFMRFSREGDPDLGEQKTRDCIFKELSRGLGYTDEAESVIERIAPDAALLIDIGYSPQGQLFDLLVARSIPCFTWNSCHRNSMLMLKRYSQANRNMHPSSISDATWNRIKAMPWSDGHRDRLSEELEFCYHSGQWYAGAGTAVNKVFPDSESLKKSLGLDAGKKTAVIFSHIFWDGSFFWGKDLFDNYEDWFKKTILAAAANTSLNWIIKIHPANLVKDKRDGYTGVSSEEKAIREALGELPGHITLLPADSKIATLALHGIMDYCLTVRGTVGIEAASAGIRVLTAGSGRYDGRGFTIDSGSREQYLELLARLHTVPPMDELETELAQRFAYGLFFLRPAPLRFVTYKYLQDNKATLEIEVNASPGDKPAENPEVMAIAAWIAGEEEDFINAEIPRA